MGVQTRHYAIFIDRLTVTLAFRMPKVKNLSRQESIFPLNSEMAKPQYKIGIFMAPAFKRFIKSIDIDKISFPYAKVATSDTTPQEFFFYSE